MLTQKFFELAEGTFRFLVDEHQFRGPTREIDEKASLAKVKYAGKYLLIECLFDRRELHVDCKVSRVIDGRETKDYAVDPYGHLVRTDLPNLFRKRGIRDRLFRDVASLEVEQRIQVTLEDFAQMLRKHGRDILNDSPTVFASA